MSTEPVTISPEMFAAADLMCARLRAHIIAGTPPRFSDVELCLAIDAWHFRYGTAKASPSPPVSPSIADDDGSPGSR